MRFYSFIFSLVFFLLISACNQEKSDSIRFGLASAPLNLDPRYATDATSTRINRLIYATLVDFDSEFKPVASLAKWKMLAPTLYRFTLSENNRLFHDNTRLTSADVKATYESILAENSGSPHRGSLSVIKQIKVINEDEIEFSLHRADSLFPAYLVVGIMPKIKIQQQYSFSNHPIGSNKLKFEQWPSQEKLILSRISDGQKIEFVHVAESTVRVLKLIKGELDLMQNELPSEMVSYLQKQKNIKVATREGTNFTYLGFNLQDPITSNPKIRQAIAHAINRKAIIKHIWNNNARLANALFPPDHWLGISADEQIAYSPEKASALLLEAGYSLENPLTLSYKTSNNPFRVRIATVIQAQLAEVGIKVEVSSYDWGTFFGDIKQGRFQMYSLSWVGIKTPDIFRYVFHSESMPPKGANRGRYKNLKIDQLIAEAESKIDIAQQAPFYQQLEYQLLKDLPYVPLWYEHHILVTRNDIIDYTLAKDGNYDGLLLVKRVAQDG